VCTYETEVLSLRGSGKGRAGWVALTSASVYFDHPVHLPAGHALVIDFLNPDRGPESRIAVELDAPSARALAHSILSILDAVPEALREEGVPS
jgi:hypothetical protein